MEKVDANHQTTFDFAINRFVCSYTITFTKNQLSMMLADVILYFSAQMVLILTPYTQTLHQKTENGISKNLKFQNFICCFFDFLLGLPVSKRV